MSTPNTKEDLRNYIRQIASEIYSEQSPKTQERIDKVAARVRKYDERLDTVKRERGPRGKEIIRKHIFGGATTVADALDGNAGKRVRQKRGAKSRKSKVVK